MFYQCLFILGGMAWQGGQAGERLERTTGECFWRIQGGWTEEIQNVNGTLRILTGMRNWVQEMNIQDRNLQEGHEVENVFFRLQSSQKGTWTESSFGSVTPLDEWNIWRQPQGTAPILCCSTSEYDEAHLVQLLPVTHCRELRRQKNHTHNPRSQQLTP